MFNRLYKSFDKNFIKKLDIKSERTYYYFNENKVKIDIKETTFENSSNNLEFHLDDPNGEFSFKSQSLFMNINIKIKNIKEIFYNYCFPGTKIGLAIEWKPDKSRIKQCVKLGEIKNSNDSMEFSKKDIELKNINSNVNFNWIIYIISPGEPNKNNYYGNELGLILGNSLLFTLVLEGDGSIFPIIEESNPGGPLWRIYCDFIDITEDYFGEENICIILNKEHKYYKYLQNKYGMNLDLNSVKALTNEFFGDAISILVLKIKELNKKLTQTEYIDLNQDCEKGSILYVLKYFNNTLHFDINGDVEKLSENIKKFFDEGI